MFYLLSDDKEETHKHGIKMMSKVSEGFYNINNVDDDEWTSATIEK